MTLRKIPSLFVKVKSLRQQISPQKVIFPPIVETQNSY